MLTYLLDQGVLTWSLNLAFQPLSPLFWPCQCILHPMSLHFLICWYFETFFPFPLFCQPKHHLYWKDFPHAQICFRFSTSLSLSAPKYRGWPTGLFIFYIWQCSLGRQRIPSYITDYSQCLAQFLACNTFSSINKSLTSREWLISIPIPCHIYKLV